MVWVVLAGEAVDVLLVLWLARRVTIGRTT